MKNPTKTLFMVISLLAIGAAGCGDGFHGSRNLWSNSGAAFNEGAGVTTLECVSVIGYEKFDSGGAASTDETGEFAPGDTSFRPDQALGYIFGYQKPVSETTKCIKAEIEIMEASGGEYYWGNMTDLLTRERKPRRPKTDEVTIVDFVSCEQIQSAACLLVD